MARRCCCLSPAAAHELRALARLTIPAAVREAMGGLPGTISLGFVGRISVSALAAVSLADIWIYTTALVLWISLNITQSTLVSQAHGAGNGAAIRGFSLISLVFGAVLSIPMAAAWWYASDVLAALSPSSGMDGAVADAYVRTAMPVLALDLPCVVIGAQLSAVQIVWPSLVAEAVLAGIDVPLAWVLTFVGLGRLVPPMGVRGTALAGVLATAGALLVYLLAAWLCPPRVLGDDDGEGEETDILEDGGGGDVSAGDGNFDAADADNRSLDAPLLAGGIIGKDTALRIPKLASSSHGVRRHAASRDNTHLRSSVSMADGVNVGNYVTPIPSDMLTDVAHADVDLSASAMTLTCVSPPPPPAVGSLLPAPTRAQLLAFLSARANWTRFVSMWAPNVVSIGLELLQWQVVSFLAADLGNTAVAAHNITIQLIDLLATSLYGLTESTTIRVGYHLGRGNPTAARRAAIIALCIGGGLGVVVAGIMLATRSVLGRLFSDDPDVVALIAHLTLYMAGAYAIFAVAITSMGVLDGQGRPVAGALVFVGGAWCVGIPLALLSAHFTSLGLDGLWGALIVGYICVAGVALLLVWGPARGPNLRFGVGSDWAALAVAAVAAAEAAVEVVDEEEEKG